MLEQISSAIGPPLLSGFYAPVTASLTPIDRAHSGTKWKPWMAKVCNVRLCARLGVLGALLLLAQCVCLRFWWLSIGRLTCVSFSACDVRLIFRQRRFFNWKWYDVNTWCICYRSEIVCVSVDVHLLVWYTNPCKWIDGVQTVRTICSDNYSLQSILIRVLHNRIQHFWNVCGIVGPKTAMKHSIMVMVWSAPMCVCVRARPFIDWQ